MRRGWIFGRRDILDILPTKLSALIDLIITHHIVGRCLASKSPKVKENIKNIKSVLHRIANRNVGESTKPESTLKLHRTATSAPHQTRILKHPAITTQEPTTMDPFSAEGELLNIHNYFHQGQYQEVIDFDTSSLSPENALPARILSLRAQIALGHAEEVIADVQGENEPELIAVGALAELAAGNEAKALKVAETLAGEKGDNAVVQVLAGTVLQAAGKTEEALALLSQHQGNRTYFTR